MNRTQNSTTLLFTWSAYNSRSQSLSDKLGAEAVFIGTSKRTSWAFANALSYPGKMLANAWIAISRRPTTIIVSNTQWVITLTNLILSRILKARLLLDSHSSAFDHTFIKYPRFLSMYFARKAALSFVTNETHAGMLAAYGARALVVTDIPFEDQMQRPADYPVEKGFTVCFICTFTYDEPIAAVMGAAELLPEVRFYVTGNSRKMPSDVVVPPNVTLTGFLTREDYLRLLNSVGAIMTLTTRQDTMQRGGSEAISVAKPLITSNTPMLRNYFRKGAVFVDPNPSSIARGIEEVRGATTALRQQMSEFRQERHESFERVIAPVKALLAEPLS
jgi:glycosyltransferase involved in cell wall biosynthesis